MSGYTGEFIRGLEWIWGEGFLSPGGPEEVRCIIADAPVTGARVLDIGCGIGGVDVVLVEDLGAAHVTAIDVEPIMVAQTRVRARSRGLGERISSLLVEPGPLPFADEAFDIVFSKDSLIHVPNKAMVYGEMFRVLRPGGMIAIGDWLGDARPPGEAMRQWLSVVGLAFSLDTLEHTVDTVRAAGFEVIDAVDRNAWYAGWIERELEALSGRRFAGLAARIGQQAAGRRLHSSRLKREVVRSGELRPAHIRARKPAPGGSTPGSSGPRSGCPASP
jgi:SAM-dependent methyltransferase